jgi:hypothetical protein
MKRNSLIIFSVVLTSFLALTSCLKKIDIPNSNTIDVTLNNAGPNFITTDVTVNPKDSIFLSYSISSPGDMKYVGIQKNPTDAKTFMIKDTLTDASKNSYSAIKKFAADSAAGVTKYRITALDAGGVYLGSKDITVTVTSDFNYYTVRTLFVPDTTAKTNQTYFSSSTGQTFSYSGVGGNSGLIDFGYFYDTAAATGHTVYALNLTPMPSPLAIYDISSWTKNATIFKRSTTPAFASLTSSGALRSAGITNLASGTASKITTLAAGNVIFFKTAAGKYGAMQVNYINGASPAASTNISLDIKIQK